MTSLWQLSLQWRYIAAHNAGLLVDCEKFAHTITLSGYVSEIWDVGLCTFTQTAVHLDMGQSHAEELLSSGQLRTPHTRCLLGVNRGVVVVTIIDRTSDGRRQNGSQNIGVRADYQLWCAWQPEVHWGECVLFCCISKLRRWWSMVVSRSTSHASHFTAAANANAVFNISV